MIFSWTVNVKTITLSDSYLPLPWSLLNSNTHWLSVKFQYVIFQSCIFRRPFTFTAISIHTVIYEHIKILSELDTVWSLQLQYRPALNWGFLAKSMSNYFLTFFSLLCIARRMWPMGASLNKWNPRSRLSTARGYHVDKKRTKTHVTLTFDLWP